MPRGPRVELEYQTYSDNPDGKGGFTRRWSGGRKISGVLTSISADKRLGPDKETVYVTHKFFCDEPKGLTISTKQQFRLGARIFDIVFVNDIAGQGRRLEIELKEIEGRVKRG